MGFNEIGAFILITGIVIGLAAFVGLALMRRKKDD